MPDEHDGALEELSSQLRALIERVDDLALDILREAADAGETERPRRERDLTRVRHALERALGILSREALSERDEAV